MECDEKLVRQAIAGRGDAFAELVRRLTHRILALCHALVRHRTTAEELTQETFVRAFVGLGTLRDPSRFAPWIKGIARRACFDWLRSQRRPMVLFSQLGDDWSPDDGGRNAVASDADSPGGSLERAEETSRLLEELDKLPEEQRVVLTLYYYGEHTYSDLAEILDVSVATINARLTKGRALLRTRLKSIRR